MTLVDSQQVYGTGLLSLDLIFRPGDEQPTQWFAGGTCGNVLAILSFLGWKSFPITRLNGDIASLLVQRDLIDLGVSLDYATLTPHAPTPMIVQRINKNSDDQKTHHFSTHCPYCRSRLPSFRAIRNDTAVQTFTHWDHPPTVFFLDRASRGMLTMAQRAAEYGALVVYEPSAKVNSNHMREAIHIAHIVKYADERFPTPLNAIEFSDNTQIEIQTKGSSGFRYRTQIGKCKNDWNYRSAFMIENIADSAGAGDWFTAALISKFPNGLNDLQELNTDYLDEIFSYANAAAAWNCQFDAARSSMYAVSLESFESSVRALQEGKARATTDHETAAIELDKLQVSPACPACP